MANDIRTSPIALKEWRLEKCLLPLGVFERLNQNYDFEKFIIEIKDENWGKSKGGQKSLGSLKEINKPKKSKELAELVGIILGDGNIHLFKRGKKIGTYALRICGHRNYDFDYLTNFVASLLQKLFHIKPKFFIPKSSNALLVNIYSKELAVFLSEIGLKIGNKIVNHSEIPPWVRENHIFLQACLRGLIDTDGSVFRMSKRDPNLIRIAFKSHNPILLRQVREAFMQLGYNPSNITNNNAIYLSRQDEVKRYIQAIGFSNSKHKKRLLKIAP